MELTADLKQAIIDAFLSFNPQKIVLFGSHARGEADPHSDIDIIVVYETDKRFLDRLEELYLAWYIPKGVDILAYTPDEFQSMKETSVFLQDVLKEGEVLYERC